MKANEEQRLEIGDSVLWHRSRTIENAPGEIIKEWNVRISPTSYRMGYNSGVVLGFVFGLVVGLLLTCVMFSNLVTPKL